MREEIKKFINECGFNIVEETSEYIELELHTPAREDWSETFWHYGLETELHNEIFEFLNNFDIEDENEKLVARQLEILDDKLRSFIYG